MLGNYTSHNYTIGIYSFYSGFLSVTGLSDFKSNWRTQTRSLPRKCAGRRVRHPVQPSHSWSTSSSVEERRSCLVGRHCKMRDKERQENEKAKEQGELPSESSRRAVVLWSAYKWVLHVNSPLQNNIWSDHHLQLVGDHFTLGVILILTADWEMESLLKSMLRPLMTCATNLTILKMHDISGSIIVSLTV